ncbi:MAG: type II secretion system protein GspJ, partial [Alishewanella aestuarii]
TGSEPLIQVLQEQLTEFEVSYWQDGQWQERWQDSLLPEAVKVRLLHDSFGELERIFVLPDALSAQGGR